MRVSIDDVAREAGVSRGTVSHVLNRNKQARIATATQEHVREVVKRLGYQPNRMARCLGRGRTDALGLIVYGMLNPFYLHLQESIEMLARERNYQLFCDTNTPLPVHDDQAKLLGWPLDGVMLWANQDQTISDYFRPGFPCPPAVYLSGEPRTDGASVVYFDVYAGAKSAMTYLLSKGHRRIAYVYSHPWVDEQPGEPRKRAHADACREAGIEPLRMLTSRHVCNRRAGLEMGMEIGCAPAHRRPAALLCFNDVLAEGILFGLRRCGLKAPDDVAIVGFDGIDEGQDLDTPLTTVKLPTSEMGKEALRILVDGPRRERTTGGDCPEQPAQCPQSASVAIATQLVLGSTA